MKNIEKKLGSVVKSLRQAAGMTQEQLAQQLTAEGLPTRQNTVAKLEGGLRPTTVSEFGALARIFNHTPAQLSDAVFSEIGERDESAKDAMREELAGLRAQIGSLTSKLEGLQYLAADVRSQLMEHEMRAALLESRIGDLDLDGTFKTVRIRGDELDEEVERTVNELREVLDGKHSEEA